MGNNTHGPSSDQRVIAVFGSAGTQPGSPDWDIAVTVGRQVADAGYVLLSGGYGGVMEAASQGACEAGGHVMGGTVGLFETRGLRPNSWVREVVPFETLGERLFFLVQRPDAIVALRGGVGTLSEVMLVWSLLQVGELGARPFVLVGPAWRRLVETVAAETTIEQNDLRWLTLVDRADEVVPAIESWWASPPDILLRLGDK